MKNRTPGHRSQDQGINEPVPAVSQADRGKVLYTKPGGIAVLSVQGLQRGIEVAAAGNSIPFKIGYRPQT
jgi:hypothetical protein